jgi:hypothetical protein
LTSSARRSAYRTRQGSSVGRRRAPLRARQVSVVVVGVVQVVAVVVGGSGGSGSCGSSGVVVVVVVVQARWHQQKQSTRDSK